MDGEVGGNLDPLGQDLHDPAIYLLLLRDRQFEISRDGREMANVVASTHRRAPLDHGLLNIAEPPRPLELRYPATACHVPEASHLETEEPRRSPGTVPGPCEQLPPQRGQPTGPARRTRQTRHPAPAAQPCATTGPPASSSAAPPPHKPARTSRPGASRCLERGLHGRDIRRHVLTQLGEHGPVRLGRGDRDPPLSKQTGCLACPGAIRGRSGPADFHDVQSDRARTRAGPYCPVRASSSRTRSLPASCHHGRDPSRASAAADAVERRSALRV